MSVEKVSFLKDGIAFPGYPYPPASIYPAGIVEYGLIREALPEHAPPEIRTIHGEVLFISARLKRELLTAAKKNNLPVVKRVDTWSLVLESFLDTTIDHSQALSVLEANGVSNAECQALRRSLREVMYAYNIRSGLWDWAHLGLADVLYALLEDGPFPVCHQYALPPDEYRRFYQRAMEIAERGRVCDTD